MKCARAIDEWARICPFCNWDQTAPASALEHQPPPPVVNYTPPAERSIKNKIIFGIVGILVLVASFGVGVIINKDGAPTDAPPTVEEMKAQQQAQRAAGPVKQADTPLVPANEPGGLGQPITSAPVAAQPGMPQNDYQRTDATAVSATEYAEMAKRAQAEKKKMSALVDPRSLTGPAYAQLGDRPQQPRRPAPVRMAQGVPQPPMTSAAQPQSPLGQMQQQQHQQQAQAEPPQMARRSAGMRTRPVPEYQPLPRMSAHGTARLALTIGADGRVKQVSIERALVGNTAQLIAAVQNWRFRPATENGEPISAPYTVEINFDR
jgi:TonB family protein